jgi:hypothetical protein
VGVLLLLLLGLKPVLLLPVGRLLIVLVRLVLRMVMLLLLLLLLLLGCMVGGVVGKDVGSPIEIRLLLVSILLAVLLVLLVLHRRRPRVELLLLPPLVIGGRLGVLGLLHLCAGLLLGR